MNRNDRAKENKTKKGLGSHVQYNVQNTLTKEHFVAGDISDKIAVHLSDGKTIVFAKSQEDVERVRKFWEKQITKIMY